MNRLVSVYLEEFKELVYFGKTYYNPSRLLEQTVNYRNFKIPHEVLLDEGAIMYPLNWLFADGTLEYLKDFPMTSIYDKLGHKTAYKVSLNSGSRRINIISPFGGVEFGLASDGSMLVDITSFSERALRETMKHLFDYDVR